MVLGVCIPKMTGDFAHDCLGVDVELTTGIADQWNVGGWRGHGLIVLFCKVVCNAVEPGWGIELFHGNSVILMTVEMMRLEEYS